MRAFRSPEAKARWYLQIYYHHCNSRRSLTKAARRRGRMMIWSTAYAGAVPVDSWEDEPTAPLSVD